MSHLLFMHQIPFTKNVILLLSFIFNSGYDCTLGDAYRTPAAAAINAKLGSGIINSLHCKRLAIDVELFKDGKFLTRTEDHIKFGEYWESLHPLNRWGGHFKSRPDGNHYEMQDL